MNGPPWPSSEDRVKRLIDRANVLLGESTPHPARVDEVLAEAAARRASRQRSGWLDRGAGAGRSLVEMNGAEAVVPALTARTAALRRAARDWASIKGVDANSIYLDRLKDRPQDAVALIAMAEMAEARDTGLFVRMLDDPRSRVRAAGLVRSRAWTGRLHAVRR